METIDYTKLSAEEKAKLKAALAADERAQKERLKEEKNTYKRLQSEFIDTYFPRLLEIAQNLSDRKAEIFDGSKTLLGMKQVVYGISDDEMLKQQSHSISNADYSKTIIIGHNIVDGWDKDLASVGVSKVNDWIVRQITPENQIMANIVRDLLKQNKEGMPKAQRVLELHNQAELSGDKELIDAVSMIKEAYRPEKTTTFIKAKMKDENGQDVWINLSMSNA
jgi:hypothetical protein